MSRPLPQFLPPLLDPEGRQRSRPGPVLAGRSLKPPPLPSLAAARGAVTVYGFTRVSRQGRVTLTADICQALGWAPERRLAARLVDGAAVFKCAETGPIVVQSSWRLWLPAAFVRRLGLSAGAGVLLVADPVEAVLTICPPALLDEMTSRIAAQKGTSA